MSEEMKRELSSLKDDVSVLRTDVSVLKTDVNVLKTDVSVLKTDVGGIKSDVGNLTSLARNTAKALSCLIGDIAEMKRDMKRDMCTKADFSTLVTRMDGFADMLQDSRWDWGKQKVRLDEHEKRITILEAKRA